MTEIKMRAAVRDGATFETVQYPADEIMLRVVDSGNVQVVEYRSQDRDGPPAHRHPWDEIEYVIEGNVEFLVGGRWVAAGPGSVQMLPAGEPHSVRIPEGQARVLMITIGAPYDQFARAVAAILGRDGFTLEELAAVAGRHGVQLATGPSEAF